MDLIERYLQAIGRHLPSQQRDDILAELRTALYDELESSTEVESVEARAIAIIKRMGPPQEVAASYAPSAEYLIGPALYPSFKLILKVVFTAVVGAQLLMILLSIAISGESFALQDKVFDIVETLAFAFGWVVIIFWLLQRTDVQLDGSKPFDPRSLPPLYRDSDRVSRAEQVFSIIISVIALVFLVQFFQRGGFTWGGGLGFFANPILTRYFPWLVISMIIGIGLDIVLLWQVHWRLATRIAAVVSNAIGLGLLLLLIQGHSVWLADAGLSTSLLGGLADLSAGLRQNPQLTGMVIFQIGLIIAAVIVGVETIVSIYRLLRTNADQVASPMGQAIFTR